MIPAIISRFVGVLGARALVSAALPWLFGGYQQSCLLQVAISPVAMPAIISRFVGVLGARALVSAALPWLFGRIS